MVTCYLRMHEIVVAVRAGAGQTDWAESLRRWRAADGVAGRDRALAAMPVTPIDLDELPATDLSAFAGLIFAGRSDQDLLAGMREKLRQFLDGGRVVVFSGQLTRGWLPGASPFETLEPHPSTADEGPPRLAEHPLFAGVPASELGAGFLYRNGAHRPPPGATVIAQRADGTPGAYLDRASSAGTVLVHGGANLLANATVDGPTARLAGQLVDWIQDEAAR